mmetsp:Transcript_92470/g.205403  ORF Transcript_92470/g.205403 Transcript_92470/m.205403 type:complete len:344 (-) Transcript_92470:10-1041(-)
MRWEAILTCILLCFKLTDCSRPSSFRHTSVTFRSKDCRFESFVNGDHREIEAASSDILFHQGTILVVQDGASRVMVHYEPGHTDRCREMSDIKCQPSGAYDATAYANLNAPCVPYTSPSLSYIRSMVGGAIGITENQIYSRIAIVGLGAQSLTIWLRYALPSTTVDAIDIDENVIQATPFLGVEPSPQLNLVQSDGRVFLEKQADQLYDAIFLDAFEADDEIPGCLRTVEFFQIVRAKLAPGGTFSMNVFDTSSSTVVATMQSAFVDSAVKVGSSPGLSNLILAVQVPAGPAVASRSITPGVPTFAGHAFEEAKQWGTEAAFQPSSPTAGTEAEYDAKLCQAR